MLKTLLSKSSFKSSIKINHRNYFNKVKKIGIPTNFLRFSSLIFVSVVSLLTYREFETLNAFALEKEEKDEREEIKTTLESNSLYLVGNIPGVLNSPWLEPKKVSKRIFY